MDIQRFLSERALRVKESGIRRIFHLAASLKDPINFSIGQPDYDVPKPIKQAAIDAIQAGHNGYTVTPGLPALREKIYARFASHYSDEPGVMVTCGVSGGLQLSLMATINPGDEVIFPDPYFVSYPNLVQWMDGVARPVSIYPDFQLDPDKLASAITPKTRLILINSPNNPTGVVYTAEQIRGICELARKHDLLIISDEIYRDLSYEGAPVSPIEFAPERTLMLGGFGKSYGMTGWRMGFAIGPKEIINQMGHMQQYTFVCAPSMAQHSALVALETDMSEYVQAYRRKRDMVEKALTGVYEFAKPSGGFYFFLKTPAKYETGTQFCESALERNLLCVPGCALSTQDSHFRISYAVDDEKVKKGCDILKELCPAS